MSSERLQGTGVSPGLALGTVLLVRNESVVVEHCAAANSQSETAAFYAAHAVACQQVEQLYQKALAEVGAELADIFDAHLSILQDQESVIDPINEKIEKKHCNAAWAVEEHMDELIDMFSSASNEYMQARAADAQDIKQRLLQVILGVTCTNLSNLSPNTILLADDLLPSQTMSMDTAHVCGILTQRGSYTSHMAILARNLEIPAIVALPDAMQRIPDGICVILDGDKGDVTLRPDAGAQVKYQESLAACAAQKAELEVFRHQPTRMRDNKTAIELMANIGTPEEARRAVENDAEGVGLFRSEFLYMSESQLPDEETQFAAYRSALEAMDGKSVTVRTLDVGGDKAIPALPLPQEENPFLGCRAIRLCLKNSQIFRVQLRALLRASAYGRLRIMFPMISDIQELREAKQLLFEEKAALLQQGVPVAQTLPVGMMVEIPSAAILAHTFAREVDFFSIGTNDLTQYTTATDRGNTEVAHLHSCYHPAVLALIANTARAASHQKIECGICGEAAADSQLLPVFLGMGVTELSMSSARVLSTRKIISTLSTERCQSLAQQALQCACTEDVKELLAP